MMVEWSPDIMMSNVVNCFIYVSSSYFCNYEISLLFISSCVIAFDPAIEVEIILDVMMLEELCLWKENTLSNV